MEEAWLPAATVANIRQGNVPQLQQPGSTPDLFGN
jgi:RHH-type rel operon transcriptional repressor/antitoxin RelB